MDREFRPVFRITPLIQRQLVAVERTVGFLNAVRLHGDWQHDLREEIRVDDALASVQIEGVTLTRERAFDLVRHPPTEPVSGGEQEFLNYLAAFDAVDALAGAKETRLGRRDLCSLHAILVRGVRGGHADGGRFRRQPVVVGDRVGDEIVVHHEPPHHDLIEEEVDALLEWLERVKRHPSGARARAGADDPWLHPVLVAGIAQHRLAWIHPFLDGNGRSARMFTAVLLYQRGYDFKFLFDLSGYYNRDRDKYYAALRTADEDGDYTRWLEYFTGGFSNQMFGIRMKAKQLAGEVR